MFDDKAIAYDEIPNMKSAIENYTANVESHLEQIKGDDITVEDGVYGGSQIAMVNAYIEATCKEINTIVRYFDDFQKKLDEVQAEYEKKQSAVSLGEVEAAKEADPSEMVTVNHME